jgi:hypothetical protein
MKAVRNVVIGLPWAIVDFGGLFVVRADGAARPKL